MNKLAMLLLIILLIPTAAVGEKLTGDALLGKWNFTHMILDGETRREVGRVVEFLSKGEVVNYDKANAEHSRATYKVETGKITYLDKHGEQEWKVLEFDGKSLHVDHSGAEMFFKKVS